MINLAGRPRRALAVGIAHLSLLMPWLKNAIFSVHLVTIVRHQWIRVEEPVGLLIRPLATLRLGDLRHSMSISELVYEQVKALPDPLAREVLEFIGYLRERGERRDLMNAQAGSLAPVWDNAADKVWDDV
jgi:hypothetical protein